jgi:hypothetical protein
MKFFQTLFFIIWSFSFLQAQTIPSFDMNDPAINKKGKISFSSLEGFTFHGNLAPVMFSNDSLPARIGFINRKGRLLVPAQFDKTDATANGYFIVGKDGRYGLLNPEGEILIYPKYKEFKIQGNQTLAGNHFYLWEVRDSLNNILESFSADSVIAESSSEYRYFLNDKSFISKHKAKGSIIATAGPEEISVKSNFPYITWEYRGKVAYENSDCNLVVPPVYDSVRYIPSDSIFIVFWKDKIGFLENDGTEIMPLTNKYKRIYDFSDGRVRILKEGRYGFLDRFGNVRVSPQYENAQDFSEGYAAVFLTGKWGFVDKDEKLAVQPFYSEVRPFTYGTARVRERNKWSFVNTAGKRINSTPYDEILPADNKKWLIVIDKKYGLADSSGKEILGPKYQIIKELNNGYIIVKKNGKWGVLDYKENFVIPIEYDAMAYDQFNNYFLTGSVGSAELINISESGKGNK